MSEHTSIGWTDHTFNIAWGCFKVSPGCKFCYAETLSKRRGHNVWGPPATTERRTFSVKHWHDPVLWNRKAERAGVRRRVFCSSMADVFEDHPTVIGELAKLWPLIRSTPWLDWQLLTKRPERIASSLPDDWGAGYENVWLGTSVESHDYLARIDELIQIPAETRFVSFEPLIGEVWPKPRHVEGIDWAIIGGESGPQRREMHVDWLTSLALLFKHDGVPVYVKQDSGARDGMQGRISDSLWALKEFPATKPITALPA